MDLTLVPPQGAVELISDLTDMDRDPRRLEPGGQPVQVELPDDSYFEYAFRDASGRGLTDPSNPNRRNSPWYGEVNYVTGPAYEADELADPPETEEGTVTRLRLDDPTTKGGVRRVTVYTPAGLAGAALPLVLVQDGVAFYRMGRVHRVADALLAAGAARPARFAFVEPGDRTVEYGFNPAYRAFLIDALLPYLDERFPATGERVWMGASLGGLLSATVAFENPGLADAVVTFSGAFLGTPADRDYYRAEDSWVLEQLRSGVRPPRKWYLEVGTLEWLAAVNGSVAEELARLGAAHEFHTRSAGHNWINWRNGMAAALRFVLAP